MHQEQTLPMKSFCSVSSGGCWCGVEICTSQVVALLLRRGPNPPRPVQPGSQSKVVLLPSAPHQILSNTSLQSQKPPPYQWAGTGNAKIPDQGTNVWANQSPLNWVLIYFPYYSMLLNRSLTFINYWQLAVFILLEPNSSPWQFWSSSSQIYSFLLQSFLFFAAVVHIGIFAPR